MGCCLYTIPTLFVIRIDRFVVCNLGKILTVFVCCLGDQVSRRGALIGGYYDTRRSRLDLQRGLYNTMSLFVV